MPRPSTKSQLIDLAEREFAALEKLIDGLPRMEDLPTGSPDNWFPADFLAHLWAWQDMFFGWYEAGRRGENPPTPADGYKWSQLPALNLAIFYRHHGRPCEEILSDLKVSHRRLMTLAEEMAEEELFTPGKYLWARTNPLSSYIVSVGSSHYLWARKEIQKSLKPRA